MSPTPFLVLEQLQKVVTSNSRCVPTAQFYCCPTAVLLPLICCSTAVPLLFHCCSAAVQVREQQLQHTLVEIVKEGDGMQNREQPL